MLLIIIICTAAVLLVCLMFATNSRASYTEATEDYYEGLNVFHLPLDLKQVNRKLEELFQKEWKEAEEEEEEEEDEEWEEDDTVIYVDAGHGCTNEDTVKGTLVGTTCDLIEDPKEGDTLYEYENTYRTALHVKDALEDAGYKVKMSRSQEEQDPNAPGNYQRGKEAAACDGAVIIHFDGSAASDRVAFFGVYPSGFAFNPDMVSTFREECGKHQVITDNTTVYTKNTSLISGYTKAGGDPSKILYVECGVMKGGTLSHQTWLASDQGQKEIAEAIIAAIKVGVPKKQKKVSTENEEQTNTQQPNVQQPNTPQTITDSNYPQGCIDAWEKTGYPQRGLHWNELDEGTKAALYEHWKIHPEGW